MSGGEILVSGFFYSGRKKPEQAAVDDQEAGKDQEHADNVVGFEGFAENEVAENQGADRYHQSYEQGVGSAGGGDDAKIDDVGKTSAQNGKH